MRPFSDKIIRRYVDMGAWETRSLGAQFDQLVELSPEQTAVVDDPTRSSFTNGTPSRLSFRELSARVDRMATTLLDAGLVPGDVVLVQLPNTWENLAIILVCMRTGLVLSPVPVQYRGKELADIIETAHPKAVLTTTNFKGFNHADMMIKAFKDADAQVFVVEDDAPEGAKPAFGTKDVVPVRSTTSADDIMTICWTSGTEAMPKGVVRTHNNWITTGKGIVAAAGIQQGSIMLNPFPMVNMASIGGLVVTWIQTGGSLVLHHPFNLGTMLKQVDAEKVNFTVLAPTLLNRFVKEKDLLEGVDISSMRSIGVGSAPPDAWMIRAFRDDFDIAITNFFGTNEGVSLTSGAIDLPDPDLRARFFPRVGRTEVKWQNTAMNWAKSRLVDPETRKEITEAGIPGELEITGPAIFPGYYRNGEILRHAFTEDGYYRSGDSFELAEVDGKPLYYRFVGRLREIIIRGGMNISPVELDSVLSEHPDLVDAAVASYPDPDLGERVCMFVVPKPGISITKEELLAFIGDRGLARYKWPEKLVILEQLPRNALNKVVRRELEAIERAAEAAK